MGDFVIILAVNNTLSERLGSIPSGHFLAYPDLRETLHLTQAYRVTVVPFPFDQD